VLHSFLPATAARLGISYERFHAINPRLVFCSITGYGERGELANKPGYDLMVQAFAGPMSVTGYEEGPPVRTGVSFVDMATGMSAYAAIASALYARERTGRGNWVRASLLETAVSILGYHGVAWLQAGVRPRKQGSGGANQAPYQAFHCADGFLLVGAPNNAAWQRLCTALEDEGLKLDPRFATNESRLRHRDELVPLLEEHFRRQDAAHWVTLLEKHGVAVAPIQGVDQVLAHPQVLANAMVATTHDANGREWKGLGTPFKIEDGGGIGSRAAPALGEHSEQILQEDLGFSAEDVAALRQGGTI
jgi:crotonobetainyl-CoA:carnitine CoA-transferase CaiB-like acyl-CoA transferase